MSDQIIPDARMTRREAMAYLRRGETWMAAHADEIGCEREGGNVFFRRADLDAYRDRGYRRAPQSKQQTVTPTRMRRLPAGINKLTGRPYGSRAS